MLLPGHNSKLTQNICHYMLTCFNHESAWRCRLDILIKILTNHSIITTCQNDTDNIYNDNSGWIWITFLAHLSHSHTDDRGYQLHIRADVALSIQTTLDDSTGHGEPTILWLLVDLLYYEPQQGGYLLTTPKAIWNMYTCKDSVHWSTGQEKTDGAWRLADQLYFIQVQASAQNTY